MPLSVPKMFYTISVLKRKERNSHFPLQFLKCSPITAIINVLSYWVYLYRVISTISKVLIQFYSTSTSFLFTIMIKCLIWKVPPGFPFVLQCGWFWCDLISIRNCDASVTSILHWYCPYSLFWCIHLQCLGFCGIIISIPVISSFSNDPCLYPQPHVASLTHME